MNTKSSLSFSIIVNCFNGEKYLHECLSSILSQSYQYWELIFWDNCSSDSSSSIFNSYGDSRFRYFLAPKHTRLYEARNLALRYCTADIITFLDVDDIWHPDFLTYQSRLFDNKGVNASCTNFYLKKNKSCSPFRSRSFSPSKYSQFASLVNDYYVGLLTFAVRRSFLLENNIYFDSNLHFMGDFDFVTSIVRYTTIFYSSTPYASYRIHEANESKKCNSLRIEEAKYWLKKIDCSPSDSFIVRNSNFYKEMYYRRCLRFLHHGRLSSALKTIHSQGVYYGSRSLIASLNYFMFNMFSPFFKSCFRFFSRKKYISHHTAIIDNGAIIGRGTKIWHWSHICSKAHIGSNCILGQNVFVADNAFIGNCVKIQNNVSVYSNVSLGDYVFCGPSVVFTNVINPRSAINRKSEYRSTYVHEHVSLGANCTIVCGVTLGEYSFIAAGAVVTRDVPPFALMMGIPAKQVGWLSRQGENLPLPLTGSGEWHCPTSGDIYSLSNNSLRCSHGN